MEKGGEVDPSDSDTYFPEDLAAGLYPALQRKTRSPLTMRTHQAEAMRRFRRERRLPAPYSWAAAMSLRRPQHPSEGI